MRILLALLSSIVFIVCSLGSFANAADGESSRVQQYLIEVSEYSLEQPIAVGLTEAELVAAIMKAGVKPKESIRMTAIAGTESMVQIGKRVSLAEGVVLQGGRNSTRYKQMEIGTIVRLELESGDQGVIADIDYTSSRVAEPEPEDAPPSVLTNTVQTVQMYTLGSPRLLSMTSADKVTCLIVTIREIPRS